MEYTKVKEDMECSASGDSDKGSCTEAPQIGETVREPVEQGADETPLTGRECPSPSNVSGENLECLAEKVSTLGLRTTSKNRCAAAKKWERKATLRRAPSGDSGDGRPRTAPGGKPQTSQTPGTSRVLWGKSTESEGLPSCPCKRQQTAGGTPWGGG